MARKINYKGKKSNFIVEKSGRYHLTKDNITSNKTFQHHLPSEMMNWKEYSILIWWCCQKHNLNLLQRNRQAILN